jgi:hypothetical protein
LITEAEADNFQVLPSVLVREEYNDNIFLSAEDEIDDFITTIAGTLEISNRTERLDASLFGRVAPFFYKDNDELDDTDWLVDGRINYWFTPLFSARANAGYLEDNRPDRDVDVTGVLLSPLTRRRTTAGADTNYIFSETTAADLSYRFQQDNFKERDLLDFDAHDISFGSTHNLSGWWETTTARFNIGYGYYDYETTQTDLIYATLGVEHRFSEKFSALIDLGPRYNHSDFETVELREVFPGIFQPRVVDDSSSEWGGVGNLEMNYRAERTFSSFSVSHGIFPASGRPGPTERTTARFAISHRLAEKLRINVPAGWIRNKAEGDQFSIDEIDQDALYIRPFIRWEFYDQFTLEAQYNFTYVFDHDDDNERYRNLIFVQLAYGIPLFDWIGDFGQVAERADSRIRLER